MRPSHTQGIWRVGPGDRPEHGAPFSRVVSSQSTPWSMSNPTTSIGVAYLHNGTASVAESPIPDHGKASIALRLPFGVVAAGSSPYLGLCDLIQRWPSTPAIRREVIMISSGADPLGGFGPVNPYVDVAIEHAQIGGVIVYAIYTPPAGHADTASGKLTQDRIISPGLLRNPAENPISSASRPLCLLPHTCAT
jgi:hypothetical protein